MSPKQKRGEKKQSKRRKKTKEKVLQFCRENKIVSEKLRNEYYSLICSSRNKKVNNSFKTIYESLTFDPLNKNLFERCGINKWHCNYIYRD